MNSDPPTVAARLELAQREARAGGELGYKVLNTGAKPLMIGEHFALERLELRASRDVQLPYAFRLMGYTLPSGKGRELTARIPDGWPVGRYRLRKRVGPVADPGPWNDWGQQKLEPLELTAEFDLVAA